jgi:hypothetical protein
VWGDARVTEDAFTHLIVNVIHRDIGVVLAFFFDAGHPAPDPVRQDVSFVDYPLRTTWRYAASVIQHRDSMKVTNESCNADGKL